MLWIFDNFRDISLISVALRLSLAMICGGIIGIERAYKRRPAGFRTHMLICIGAAVTTMTSQYLYLEMHYYTDMARLGAQVIAGIGFIGAGTIIVTRRQHVKGLTTAAGLWTSAIIGLALGGGFYEGGIITAVFVLFAEIFFAKLEFKLVNSSNDVGLYVEYLNRCCMDSILEYFDEMGIKVVHLQITRSAEKQCNSCAVFNLHMSKHCKIDALINHLKMMDGVYAAEEI